MLRSALLLALLSLLGLVLIGCPVRGGSNGGDDDDLFGDDDDSGGDDDDASGDDDDATTPIPPETDCDDGEDNDGNGLTDCDDPECQATFPACNWPEAIAQGGNFDFDGNEITCDVGGFDFPYDVDDCDTVYTSTMTTELTVPECAHCDRTFEGPLTYSVDTCAELLDTTSPPSTGFGLVFHSASEWEFFAQNGDTGAWESGGTATDDGTGTFVFSTTSTISDDPPDCNNGIQELGDLTVTLTFRDASTP